METTILYRGLHWESGRKMETTTICRVILQDWSLRILAQAGTGESNVYTTCMQCLVFFQAEPTTSAVSRRHNSILQNRGPDGSGGNDRHPRAAKQSKNRESGCDYESVFEEEMFRPVENRAGAPSEERLTSVKCHHQLEWGAGPLITHNEIN